MMRLPRHMTANPRRQPRPGRWAALAIAVVSLVSLGSGEPPDYGRGVGVLDNGTLIVELGGLRSHVSVDGGSTWQPMYVRMDGGWQRASSVDEQWEDAVRWGDEEVETPRGRYVIEATAIEGAHTLVDITIVRIEGGGKEAVYSPPHLQDASDVRFRDRQHSAQGSLPWRAPRNLVYDARSGNIVAVLGLEGVVIGDAAENWRPLLAEIGGRSVDVSFRAKTALVLGGLWPVAALIGITATAAALAFTRRANADQPSSYDTSFPRILTVSLLLLPPLAAVYLLVAGFWGHGSGDLLFAFNAMVALLGSAVIWLNDRVFQAGVTGLLVGPTVPVITALALFGLLEWGYHSGGLSMLITSIASLAGAVAIWRKARAVVGVSSLLLASIVSAVGLATVHVGGPSVGIADAVAGLAFNLALLAGFAWSLVAIVSFVPPHVRRLHVVFAAPFGMAGLVALAFVIGVAQGFDMGAAKLYAIVLILPAVWGLRRYLMRCQHSAVAGKG